MNPINSTEFQSSIDYDSDSDSVPPEEVGKKESELIALKQLVAEQKATREASERLKSRRRLVIERNTEQKRVKQEKKKQQEKVIEQSQGEQKEKFQNHDTFIPSDLLAMISSIKKGELELTEDLTNNDEQDDDNKRLKNNKRLNKNRKIITKTLITPATNFQVLNYNEITQPMLSARKNPESCFHFRDQQLFGRKKKRNNNHQQKNNNNNKIKRIRSSMIVANRMKRSFGTPM